MINLTGNLLNSLYYLFNAFIRVVNASPTRYFTNLLEYYVHLIK
jgi:hypothetical protein